MRRVKEARLWRIVDGSYQCLVCERRCLLKEGRCGICGNYGVVNGKVIHIGYGLLSAIESRPIEVKPLFHYWPNSTALTFSNYGCNFYCPWCQNYHLSFEKPPMSGERFEPELLVKMALKYGDEGLCASFNEPATQFDFLIDVFSEGKKHGLYSTLVTNGYFTERAIEELVNAGADGFSIDIKGCPKSRSIALASIDHEIVFRNAKKLLDLGAHVEMVYLVVTGFNDFDECIEWILSKHLDYLGPSVPLHINRYYPANYWRMPPTPIPKLMYIKDLAIKMGIEYVYVGNIGSSEYETTRCPKCGKVLIVRSGYRVTYYNLDGNRCPRCGYAITMRGKYIAHKRFWWI